ncbi:MAG: IclR family transcriptional regulator [Chloroflexi bacterium]|nr:IclR family transcriptional regulator [Chloroflexota bacterium]
MKSLNKAIDVLELFLNGEDEMRLSELAQLSGLDKATVDRIVTAWASRGYLRQHKARGKYSLGMRFLDFSGLIKKRNTIRNMAMPYMIKLSQLTRESVMLSILDRNIADYCEMVPASHPLRIVPDEGSSFPLYCTAIGKAFLAAMTEEELENYLHSTELKAYTANTLTEVNQLKTHLMVVAKEGVAFDDEEYFLGIRSVAAGIKDGEGKTLAAIGVLGPTIRLTRRHMLEIVPDVKNCALEISNQLVYRDK